MAADGGCSEHGRIVGIAAVVNGLVTGVEGVRTPRRCLRRLTAQTIGDRQRRNRRGLQGLPELVERRLRRQTRARRRRCWHCKPTLHVAVRIIRVLQRTRQTVVIAKLTSLTAHMVQSCNQARACLHVPGCRAEDPPRGCAASYIQHAQRQREVWLQDGWPVPPPCPWLVCDPGLIMLLQR